MGRRGVLVLVASLLWSCRCDASCKGLDGQAGEAGAPGRDGWPGAKGEKGEPAGFVDAGVLLRLKAETGSRGPPGAMGPKGYRGTVGASGRPGPSGAPGPDGRHIGHGQVASQQVPHSAFSAFRTESSYPPFGRVVTFQRTEVNKPADFNPATGYFTCRVPGVYYFTFHSMAKASVCLQIVRDNLINKPTFCNHKGTLNKVLSGGVVLQLAVGEKVWLESFRDKQTDADARDNHAKQIIFNGFLLFPE